MIPCHQGVTVLQRIIQQKEAEALEMAKAKRDNMGHAKALAHERHDEEES